MSSQSQNNDKNDQCTPNYTMASVETVALTADRTPSESVTEPVAECSTSQEVPVEQATDTHRLQRSNEFCIVIPNSVTVSQNGGQLMFIEARGFVPDSLRPQQLDLNSRFTSGCPRNDEVTVNLSNFLTFARRRCAFMIPATNSCYYSSSSHLDSPHRIAFSEQQNLPQSSGSAVASFPSTEFIGIHNNISPRNSVLMPNLDHSSDDIRPPVVDFDAPPPYDSPVKLPTYEEVQREKELEADSSLTDADSQRTNDCPSRPVSFFTVNGESTTAADTESKLLGTDFMFAISFFLAFLFNWVGFMLLLCFCRTVASRYGALSGFGLSLAKWTVIVKQTSAAPLNNAWLWWLIAIFGLLICVRSIFQYIHIKRGWRLMSATMQERLLVYY